MTQRVEFLFERYQQLTNLLPTEEDGKAEIENELTWLGSSCFMPIKISSMTPFDYIIMHFNTNNA